MILLELEVMMVDRRDLKLLLKVLEDFRNFFELVKGLLNS
jgi:hypothetical protein